MWTPDQKPLDSLSHGSQSSKRQNRGWEFWAGRWPSKPARPCPPPVSVVRLVNEAMERQNLTNSHPPPSPFPPWLCGISEMLTGQDPEGWMEPVLAENVHSRQNEPTMWVGMYPTPHHCVGSRIPKLNHSLEYGFYWKIFESVLSHTDLRCQPDMTIIKR